MVKVPWSLYIGRDGVHMTTALFAGLNLYDDGGYFRFVAMRIFNPLSRDGGTTLHHRGDAHIGLRRRRYGKAEKTHADEYADLLSHHRTSFMWSHMCVETLGLAV